MPTKISISIQVTNKYTFTIHWLHYISLSVLVGSGLTPRFCTAAFQMFQSIWHVSKWTERMLMCSARLTDPVQPTFAHLLPIPSCPPPLGAMLPAQLLCSSHKVRKQLVTETFPYSAILCCHTPAVSSKLTEQKCTFPVCGRTGSCSSILHHSLQGGSKQFQQRRLGSGRLSIP